MIPLIQHRNRTVRVDTTQIVENALAQTFLSANMAAASGTLTVSNIEKFAVGKYVWINPFSEKSEIIAVHASTAPSGSTITLAANTTYAHNASEPVYYVEFNQAEFNIASTLTGSKSVLATVALEAGNKETVYLDTANSSGYYFVRLKDSVAGTFSSYSDGCVYGGFASNTVGYMVDQALSDLSLNLSAKITLRDCFQWINKGIKLVQGKLKRWPEHATYNYVAGQVSRGVNTLTMPTDAYDTEGNKSVMGFRIGTGIALSYVSPIEFDNELVDVARGVVTSQASVGATSLAVTNSYDFEDSGSVNVYISGTKYTLTYTAVTRSSSSGALTGIPASGDGSITAIIPADTVVWQNEIEGEPSIYTVRNGALEWWPLADDDHDNTNAYLDYWHVASSVDGEGDTIDLQRFDMLQNYLTWRMKMKARHDGNLDQQDGYYLAFKEDLNDAIRTLSNNHTTKITPKINRMQKRAPFIVSEDSE